MSNSDTNENTVVKTTNTMKNKKADPSTEAQKRKKYWEDSDDEFVRTLFSEKRDNAWKYVESNNKFEGRTDASRRATVSERMYKDVLDPMVNELDRCHKKIESLETALEKSQQECAQHLDESVKLKSEVEILKLKNYKEDEMNAKRTDEDNSLVFEQAAAPFNGPDGTNSMSNLTENFSSTKGCSENDTFMEDEIRHRPSSYMLDGKKNNSKPDLTQFQSPLMESTRSIKAKSSTQSQNHWVPSCDESTEMLSTPDAVIESYDIQVVNDVLNTPPRTPHHSKEISTSPHTKYQVTILPDPDAAFNELIIPSTFDSSFQERSWSLKAGLQETNLP